METKDLDIVYVLKEGRGNELRYSLRSLKNFPHRRVWVYGACPEWVTGVFYVPCKQGGIRWQNTSNMLKLAASNPNISDDFVYFNDDFFIMKPIKKLNYYYEGTLSARVENGCKIRSGSVLILSRYGRQLMRCEQFLRVNRLECKNYELHLPMIFNKKKLLKTWRALPNDGYGARRSLYGNFNNVGGTNRDDCKVYEISEKYDGKDFFVSTTDITFPHGVVGKQIREAFKEKCIYEK